MKKRYASLAVIIIAVITIGLVGCGAFRTPNPIVIDTFVSEAQARDFEITQDNDWTIASKGNTSVEIKQFESNAEARQEFERIRQRLSNEFRSRSRSAEVSGTNHSSWVFNASGNHIRLWRVYDVVVYGRDTTGNRDTLSDFFGSFIIRD
ncbi:MAG: hypothetical protein FWC80_04055 [Firmicutes bacterium]|nr:hypothetical protein [Bacillota bacterium]